MASLTQDFRNGYAYWYLFYQGVLRKIESSEFQACAFCDSKFDETHHTHQVTPKRAWFSFAAHLEAKTCHFLFCQFCALTRSNRYREKHHLVYPPYLNQCCICLLTKSTWSVTRCGHMSCFECSKLYFESTDFDQLKCVTCRTPIIPRRSPLLIEASSQSIDDLVVL